MRPQGAFLSQARNAARGGGLSLEMRIRQMFASQNLNGFILDAGDISTLNQVSTGTTPVTAVTQPIGLMLDKHLGMQLGPELSLGSNFTTWVNAPASMFDTFTASSTALILANATEKVAAAYHPDSIPVIAGKSYKIVVSVERTSGSYDISLRNGGAGTVIAATATLAAGGSVELIGVATVTENVVVQLTSRAGTGAQNLRITSVSVKLLDGNHALQATAAARPTWQVDASGYHYAQLLGTDDSLSCATGGGGDAGFLFCAALKPTGGAGTSREIFSDITGNNGYIVRLNTSNKLVLLGGNGAVFTAKASTASYDVGTLGYFTTWDDGTNFNVQIDGSAAETVARPVVVAGAAGYTLGKTNGAATNFLIADFYRAVYIKNWAGTAAQLADIQKWVKAGAGL